MKKETAMIKRTKSQVLDIGSEINTNAIRKTGYFDWHVFEDAYPKTCELFERMIIDIGTTLNSKENFEFSAHFWTYHTLDFTVDSMLGSKLKNNILFDSRDDELISFDSDRGYEQNAEFDPGSEDLAVSVAVDALWLLEMVDEVPELWVLSDANENELFLESVNFENIENSFLFG